jgi:RHH-type rel operon transcriptional repressor/antitoxin RelB
MEAIQSGYVATTIRLSQEIDERLVALAAQMGKSKSDYLRLIVENGISEVEDYYDAAATLARVRSGDEPVFSCAQVRDELGLGN